MYSFDDVMNNVCTTFSEVCEITFSDIGVENYIQDTYFCLVRPRQPPVVPLVSERVSQILMIYICEYHIIIPV